MPSGRAPVYCIALKAKLNMLCRAVLMLYKKVASFTCSFKQGEGERLDERGRFFNDYTVVSLTALIATFDQLEVIDIWQVTTPLRGQDQTWVNGLVRKVLSAKVSSI